MQAHTRLRPGGLGFNAMCASMGETRTLLLSNNKRADQPAHPHSLISAFVLRYLKSKLTRSDISYFFFLVLRLDRASGYAPELAHRTH